MRVIAIPVKALSRAKSRLSPVLSRLERAALTLAMLEDVLDAAVAVPGWETWVVSRDETVLEIAARRQARPVMEERPPLAAAVRQVGIEADEMGAEALTVLLADLPLLTTEALQDALRTIGPVVLAPSSSDGGTNLLLRRPPRNIAARFGSDSFRKHRDTAEARGLPVAVIERPELTTDLDVPEDAPEVLAADKDGRTRASLLELDLLGRLAARA